MYSDLEDGSILLMLTFFQNLWRRVMAALHQCYKGKGVQAY